MNATAIATGLFMTRKEDDNDEMNPRLFRRATDASKLMLPIWLTVTLVGGTLSAAGGVWTVYARVDKVALQMTADKELRLEQMNGLRESIAGMKDIVNRVNARQELQQYEIQQLKDTVQELKALMNKRSF